MPPHASLISDSFLITETVQFLQSFGGRAPAVKIVDSIMRISKPEPALALTLISDLIENDPRLKLTDDFVELIENNVDKRKFSETDFVVFDLETTGAKTPPCRITEIGAFKIQNGKITDKFETLVNPQMFIPSFIIGLTGINNQMVRNAPKFWEVAEDFLNFIGDSVLVAHNAAFDLRFLNHEIDRIYGSYRVGNPHLCTVKLSRKLLPNIANHRLHTVADYYSIRIKNRHRAAGDALATAEVFVNFLELMQSVGVDDLASIHKLKHARF